MSAESNQLTVLGITDNMRPLPLFENYLHWVARIAPGVQMRKLSCLLENAAELEACHGLILTGGGDVHPKFYHREDALPRVEEVNERRDEFEFAVIDDALRLQMPVLGICRGMQIFNVAMGGSLHPDLEVAGYPSHRRGDVDERLHPILAEENSRLHGLVQWGSGEINTVHHQAVDKVGLGLRVCGRSADGVVEALEWEDPTRDPFLLLIQWHPERLKNFENPFSRKVLEGFLKAVREHQEKQTIQI